MTEIRVATIGSSTITDSFLAGARHDGRFIHEAVYSRSAEKGGAFAAKHNAKKLYTSLEDLAADRDVDAVYIASPNSCHAEQAIAMMNAGKHVICEKPVATTPEDFERMAEAAIRNRVSFLEAMKTTLLPNFRAVRDALGKIGTIRRYTAQYCQYSSKMALYQQGKVASNMDPRMGGGARLDLGIYCIAPMVHLFGAPWQGEFSRKKLEECITAQSTTVYPGSDLSRENSLHPELGIDGQGSMLIRYPGMECVLTYSKITDSQLPAEIQGDNGAILIDHVSLMQNPRIVYRKGCGTRGDSGFHNEFSGSSAQAGTEDLSQETIADNMFYEVREFFDMIESGRIESEHNTFERSLICMQICSR